MISGKRELLACGLYWSGILRCLRLAPAKSTLLVLNYHRIGDARKDLFDPGVFSATSEEFDEQVSFLKRRTSIVGLEEAEEFVAGHLRDTRPQCRVLITFDDGYLDNYQLAFP